MNLPRRLVSLALASLVLLLPAVPAFAADPYPTACVSCHTVDKAKGVDRRISTALQKWSAGKVDTGLLAKSKAASPAGLTLKGKHPSAEDSLESIPEGCMDCHGSDSKKAPPFSRLMHVVHLTGANNAFVANYKGDCQACHKLNVATGELSMPNGVEK